MAMLDLTVLPAMAVYLLNSWGWEILPYPPYSPDSSIHSRGQHFRSSEDVQNKVKKFAGCITSMKDLTKLSIRMISI
jgi:hypothetical protein